ncbi:MAG: FecR domain-containing protein [Pseudomonadales bacterium]
MAQAADWVYTVRPSDSLWNLAVRYCGQHGRVPELAAYNGLTNPQALRAGMTLRFPVSCLIRQPASARVVVADASTLLEREGERRVVTLSDAIVMGDTLITGEGFAVVEFADGSRMTIQPDSEISFALLSGHADSGMVDTLARLHRGRVQHSVPHSDEGLHRHRIATPVGAAAVRGTEFRVELPDSARTTVATTRGEVAFSQPKRTPVALPRGMGLVASAEGASTEALLPAPMLGRNAIVPRGRPLVWDPVEGAQGYRIIIHDAAHDPVAQVVVETPAWVVDHPPGVVPISVRAIAASGLEGFDAQTNLNVLTAAPSPVIVAEPATGAGVSLAWTGEEDGPYTVRITGSDGTREIAAAGQDIITSLPPGHYRWQVANASGAWSDEQRLAVAPAPLSGLTAARATRDVPLAINWQNVQPGVRVQVVVSQNGRQLASQTSTATANGVVIDLPVGCHPCSLQATAELEDLRAPPVSIDYRDPPVHPWPLYVALALIALLI